MEVTVAKTAGFCFGVKRAVDTVYGEVNKGSKIYTYGPIIHNEEVVNDLKAKGVTVLNGIDELKALKDGTVIIRSHGVGEDIYKLIEENGLKLVDATCPFVKKIHGIVKKHSDEGYQVIVIGNRDHPEVKGIEGWCNKSIPAVIIENEEEAYAFKSDKSDRLCIVSQTTFNHNKFQELVEIFDKIEYYSNVVNTICNATMARQIEASELASRCDAMIVIGGLNSSNTQKLYRICRRECENTQYIQTLNDLNVKTICDVKNVGITAGASTPNNIIEEVQNYVRINF